MKSVRTVLLVFIMSLSTISCGTSDEKVEYPSDRPEENVPGEDKPDDNPTTKKLRVVSISSRGVFKIQDNDSLKYHSIQNFKYDTKGRLMVAKDLYETSRPYSDESTSFYEWDNNMIRITTKGDEDDESITVYLEGSRISYIKTEYHMFLFTYGKKGELISMERQNCTVNLDWSNGNFTGIKIRTPYGRHDEDWTLKYTSETKPVRLLLLYYSSSLGLFMKGLPLLLTAHPDLLGTQNVNCLSEIHCDYLGYSEFNTHVGLTYNKKEYPTKVTYTDLVNGGSKTTDIEWE